MRFDFDPCAVCGSEIRLRAATPPDTSDTSDIEGPVGTADGVVGRGDPTVDDRLCTNPDCPTNQQGRSESP